ncbi:MAG: hypothetical protein ACJZ4F_04400 [Candidatus Thalassarchaeaceae archaeon]
MPNSKIKKRYFKNRKKNASKAMLFLSNILNERNLTNDTLADSVAKSIMRLGKKHGIRTKKDKYNNFCRTCQSSLIPGKSCRVRISNGFILNTCMTCQRIYRFRLDNQDSEENNDESPITYNQICKK